MDGVTLRFRARTAEQEFQKHFYRTVIWRRLHLQACGLTCALNVAMALVFLANQPLQWLWLLEALLALLPVAFSIWFGVHLYLDDRYYTRKVTQEDHAIRTLGSLLFVIDFGGISA